jgi:glycine/D-amino acid oxidase-like deaminating enzyme
MSRRYGKDAEDLLWEMRWAGNDIIRDRVQKYAIKCDLKWGYLDVAIKGRHLRDFERAQLELTQKKFRHESRLLDAAETADLIGTREYIGSLLNMGNGHVHPLNLCIGEARAVESLGATIYEQSPVLGIEYGDKAKVVTGQGSVTAAAVILAGNAYHDVDRKLRGYLFPIQSFIIATEPLSEDLVEQINREDLAVCDPNFVLEYFRLSGDKRLLFGGRIRHFGDDEDFIRSRLRKKMLRIYPRLKDLRIDYAWTGKIGVTVSRVVQLGRLSPNVYFCQGYSGHGVNMTHLTGQIMADAVGGTLERFDLFATIKPVILPGAHLFRRPMTSLGMMYYQLKDSL